MTQNLIAMHTTVQQSCKYIHLLQNELYLTSQKQQKAKTKQNKTKTEKIEKTNKEVEQNIETQSKIAVYFLKTLHGHRNDRLTCIYAVKSNFVLCLYVLFNL